MNCFCFFLRKTTTTFCTISVISAHLSEMLCLLQEVTRERTGVLKCTNVGNESNDVTVFMTVTL